MISFHLNWFRCQKKNFGFGFGVWQKKIRFRFFPRYNFGSNFLPDLYYNFSTWIVYFYYRVFCIVYFWIVLMFFIFAVGTGTKTFSFLLSVKFFGFSCGFGINKSFSVSVSEKKFFGFGFGIRKKNFRFRFRCQKKIFRFRFRWYKYTIFRFLKPYTVSWNRHSLLIFW